MKKLIYTSEAIKRQYFLTLLLLFALISTSAGESLKKRYSIDDIAKIEQLKSFRSFGTIKMGKTVGTIETFYSKPGLSRSTLALENFQIIQVFNGVRAWMKDQNGQVIELTGPDKKQLESGWSGENRSRFL